MSIIQTGRRALACLALLLGAGTAHASSFAYTSTAGEPLGGGVGTRTLASPTATFSTYGNRNHIVIDVDQAGEHWNLQFRGPLVDGYGADLRRTSYVDAEHAAFQTALAPGLEILGSQDNCIDVYGSFKIRQLTFNFDGTIQKLEATFTHRCGSTTAPVLTGTIYYDTKPRSYSYSRQAGATLGTGTAKTSYGDTTNISAGGFNNVMDWDVSGQRDTWHFRATAPDGQVFTKGKTYALAAYAGPTHAGLTVDWNGNGPGICPNVAGTLKINNISTFEGTGEINGLYATATIYCNGETTYFKGIIRYDL